jgi:hypothetical protein
VFVFIFITNKNLLKNLIADVADKKIIIHGKMTILIVDKSFKIIITSYY